MSGVAADAYQADVVGLFLTGRMPFDVAEDPAVDRLGGLIGVVHCTAGNVRCLFERAADVWPSQEHHRTL